MSGLKSKKTVFFAVIEPFIAQILDKKWSKVFGEAIFLQGGFVLTKTPTAYKIINQYLPEIRISVEDKFQKNITNIEQDTAIKINRRGKRRCVHKLAEPGCLYCLYKMWNGENNGKSAKN